MTTGYARQQTIALEHASPEQTLAYALTTAARRMAQAKDPVVPREQVLDSVRLNWRIWTIIQAEQCDPACKTEKSVREGMLNLANFVDKRSIDILARPTPEKLDVLINVNRNIAAGLLGTDLTPDERAAREQRRPKTTERRSA